MWNPQNKDPWFLEVMFADPTVEALLVRFLNDPWYRQIPQDAPNYILRNLLAGAAPIDCPCTSTRSCRMRGLTSS